MCGEGFFHPSETPSPSLLAAPPFAARPEIDWPSGANCAPAERASGASGRASRAPKRRPEQIWRNKYSPLTLDVQEDGLGFHLVAVLGHAVAHATTVAAPGLAPHPLQDQHVRVVDGGQEEAGARVHAGARVVPQLLALKNRRRKKICSKFDGREKKYLSSTLSFDCKLQSVVLLLREELNI